MFSLPHPTLVINMHNLLEPLKPQTLQAVWGLQNSHRRQVATVCSCPFHRTSTGASRVCQFQGTPCFIMQMLTPPPHLTPPPPHPHLPSLPQVFPPSLTKKKRVLFESVEAGACLPRSFPDWLCGLRGLLNFLCLSFHFSKMRIMAVSTPSDH